MENRWNTDTERRDMTVWLFDEDSFVPVAMIKEGKSYSILTDQLGTPTEAYDAEGNEVWSRVLDMDGNVIEETGNKGMVPFLFQGQYYDRETGLAYNRFRYYSPKMGMYVSQDPIGLFSGLTNLYGYVIDTNISIDVLGLLDFMPNDTDLFPVTGAQKNTVVITMQGSRGRDFTAAYKAAGISRSQAKGYTWHHVDDFDPQTGTTTMQLVRTNGRHQKENHSGSVKQFESKMKVKYGTRKSVNKAYKKGWVTGRKPSYQK